MLLDSLEDDLETPLRSTICNAHRDLKFIVRPLQFICGTFLMPNYPFDTRQEPETGDVLLYSLEDDLETPWRRTIRNAHRDMKFIMQPLQCLYVEHSSCQRTHFRQARNQICPLRLLEGQIRDTLLLLSDVSPEYPLRNVEGRSRFLKL